MLHLIQLEKTNANYMPKSYPYFVGRAVNAFVSSTYPKSQMIMNIIFYLSDQVTNVLFGAERIPGTPSNLSTKSTTSM